MKPNRISEIFCMCKDIVAYNEKECSVMHANLCGALNQLKRENLISIIEFYNVDSIVTDLLFPYPNLEKWLDAKYGINRESCPVKFSDKIQATRHDWLDHLISHYWGV